MRAYTGQRSDNQPIRRNFAEKQKQLRDLKETLASMKPHTAQTLRESVQRRIRELEVELRSAPKPDDTRKGTTGAAQDHTHRRPRRPRFAETFNS